MKKKYDLTEQDIHKLKRDIENIEKDIQKKCNIFIEKLLDIGITVASAKINESPLGKYINLKTDISENQNGCKGILIAIGETKKKEGYAPFNILLAVEFGAGIYYNQKPNPNANKLGFGVGTFPGQIHAFDDGWYYWEEATKEWKYTHGVKATMPIYNAEIAIIKNVSKIAKDVFKIK